MIAEERKKWVASLILAGVLVILAAFGGDWGKTYAADVLNTPPTIVYFIPPRMAVGSPDKMLIIVGDQFGFAPDEIRVWVRDELNEYLITPTTVITTAISVNILAGLKLEPTVYTITVIKSDIGTVPIIPTVPDPEFDHLSNDVLYVIFTPFNRYLPLINRLNP